MPRLRAFLFVLDPTASPPHITIVTETQISLILIALLGLSVWGMVAAVRSAKVKKTGSTLIVAAMFGFAKLLNPRQVDVEEARQKPTRKQTGENGDQK